MIETEITKKLKSDLITYMKAQDTERLNVIRGILNEINMRDMRNIKITYAEVIKVLRSEIKKRKESIESFKKGGRHDLVAKEQNEIKIIETYLPPELSDEELLTKIKQIVDTCEDKNFGTVMKTSTAILNGTADGKRIAAAVRKLLVK
ncbi:MAG: GatB/YqeY domain-containing protein [Endomicrobium sp.]|jgi:uncharacterized protein YqeY|nr:GatB/YqeY domain-containing protein [Endomicrobium sp.]